MPISDAHDRQPTPKQPKKPQVKNPPTRGARAPIAKSTKPKPPVSPGVPRRGMAPAPTYNLSNDPKAKRRQAGKDAHQAREFAAKMSLLPGDVFDALEHRPQDFSTPDSRPRWPSTFTVAGPKARLKAERAARRQQRRAVNRVLADPFNPKARQELARSLSTDELQSLARQHEAVSHPEAQPGFVDGVINLGKKASHGYLQYWKWAVEGGAYQDALTFGAGAIHMMRKFNNNFIDAPVLGELLKRSGYTMVLDAADWAVTRDVPGLLNEDQVKTTEHVADWVLGPGTMDDKFQLMDMVWLGVALVGTAASPLRGAAFGIRAGAQFGARAAEGGRLAETAFGKALAEFVATNNARTAAGGLGGYTGRAVAKAAGSTKKAVGRAIGREWEGTGPLIRLIENDPRTKRYFRVLHGEGGGVSETWTPARLSRTGKVAERAWDALTPAMERMAFRIPLGRGRNLRIGVKGIETKYQLVMAEKRAFREHQAFARMQAIEEEANGRHLARLWGRMTIGENYAVRAMAIGVTPEQGMAYHSGKMAEAIMMEDTFEFALHASHVAGFAQADRFVMAVAGKPAWRTGYALEKGDVKGSRKAQHVFEMVKRLSKDREGIMKDPSGAYDLPMIVLDDAEAAARISVVEKLYKGGQYIPKEDWANWQLLQQPNRQAAEDLLRSHGVPEDVIQAGMTALDLRARAYGEQGLQEARAHMSYLTRRLRDLESGNIVVRGGGQNAAKEAVRQDMIVTQQRIARGNDPNLYWENLQGIHDGFPQEMHELMARSMGISNDQIFMAAEMDNPTWKIVADDMWEAYKGHWPQEIESPEALHQAIVKVVGLTHRGMGLGGRDWYLRAATGVNFVKALVNDNLVGVPNARGLIHLTEPITTDQAVQIFAILSQGDNTVNNVGQTFKAFAQFHQYGDIHAGRWPEGVGDAIGQSQQILNVLRGGSWEGRKRSSFYANIMKYADPEGHKALGLNNRAVTVDMHIMRMFHPKIANRGISDQQYDAFEALFQAMGDIMGMEPDTVQAAAWVAFKQDTIDAMPKGVARTTLEKAGAHDAFEYGIDKYGVDTLLTAVDEPAVQRMRSKGVKKFYKRQKAGSNVKMVAKTREDVNLASVKWREPSIDEFLANYNANPQRRFMSEPDIEVLQASKRFMSEDGKIAFAITPENDLINVSSLPGAMPDGGLVATYHAIDNGALTLDCYDGLLPEMYRAAGFKETARMHWNPEYAPPDWPVDQFGEPDVVFMSLTTKNRKNNYITDWDAAKAESLDKAIRLPGIDHTPGGELSAMAERAAPTIALADSKNGGYVHLPAVRLRSGRLPAGASTNHLAGDAEKGVSVYSAWYDPKTKKYVLASGDEQYLATQGEIATERPLYLVAGDETAHVGADGEPLLGTGTARVQHSVSLDDVVTEQDPWLTLSGKELPDNEVPDWMAAADEADAVLGRVAGAQAPPADAEWVLHGLFMNDISPAFFQRLGLNPSDYTGLTRSIFISEHTALPTGTFFHEFEHYVQKQHMLTKAEWNTLRRAAESSTSRVPDFPGNVKWQEVWSEWFTGFLYGGGPSEAAIKQIPERYRADAKRAFKKLSEQVKKEYAAYRQELASLGRPPGVVSPEEMYWSMPIEVRNALETSYAFEEMKGEVMAGYKDFQNAGEFYLFEEAGLPEAAKEIVRREAGLSRWQTRRLWNEHLKFAENVNKAASYRSGVNNKGVSLDQSLVKHWRGKIISSGNFTGDVVRGPARQYLRAIRIQAQYDIRDSVRPFLVDRPTHGSADEWIAFVDDLTKDAESLGYTRKAVFNDYGKVQADAIEEMQDWEMDQLVARMSLGVDKEHDELSQALAARLMTNPDVSAENVKWVHRSHLYEIPELSGQGLKIPDIASQTVGSLFDMMNTILKDSVLLLHPAYYPMNLLGNAGMNFVQGPVMAPINLFMSSIAHANLGHDTTTMIDTLLGGGWSTIFRARGNTPFSHFQNALASGANALVDTVPRRAAFIHEARRLGYRGSDRIKELIHDPNNVDDLMTVVLRAKRAMVDFDNMSRFERDVISRYIFVYPWIRGATEWTLRLPGEHPVLTAAGAVAWYQQNAMANDALPGGRPTYMQFFLPIAEVDRFGEKVPWGLNVRQLATPSTPFEIASNIYNVATGDPKMQALSEMLQPLYGNLIVMITGWDSFKKQQVTAPLPEQIIDMFNPVKWPIGNEIDAILRSDEERRRDAEQGRLYPRNKRDDWLRLFLGSIATGPVNKDTAHARSQYGPQPSDVKAEDWATKQSQVIGEDLPQWMVDAKQAEYDYQARLTKLKREANVTESSHKMRVQAKLEAILQRDPGNVDAKKMLNWLEEYPDEHARLDRFDSAIDKMNHWDRLRTIQTRIDRVKEKKEAANG